MNFSKFILPAMVLSMATSYTSCSNDADEMQKPTVCPVEVDGQLVKVRLHLNGNSATRGTDNGFQNGTEKETHIKSLTLTFYDVEGKYLSCNTLTEDEIGAGLIVVSTKTDTQPSKLLAWANIQGAATLLSGMSFDEALAKTCTSGVTGVDGYFVMTSSSFMKDGNIVYGSDITPANTAFSQDDVIEASAIDVYLERIAAKVMINKNDQISVELPTYSNQGVTFELQGMALNGTNKTSYYVKNIADYGFDLNRWSSAWNVADLCRSYWATDPNYIEEGANLSAYNYRTYNEIRQDINLSEYCFENTSGNETFNIQNATHVLLVGQYTLEGVRKGANLYLYNGKLMTAMSYKSLVHNKYPFYAKDANGNYKALDNTIYVITRNGQMGLNAANVKIQLKLEAEQEIFKSVEGNYQALTVTEANAELAQEPDGIKYGQGKCYYAAPIQHLGLEGEVGQYGVVRNHLYQITIASIKSFGSGVWDPGTDPDEPGDDPVDPGIDPGEDPDDPNTPDDDPDDPTPDPGEPIVPEPQDPEENYYVGLQIKVLDWHVVSQDVDL